jgi:hypothetical protein
MPERVIAAAEKAKSVASDTDAPEAVALTVKVAAPAAEPVTEEMPTVAMPVAGSVRAVADVSVASAELRLKLINLLPTGAPVPSFNTTLALYPLEPILVTVAPVASIKLAVMVTADGATLVDEKSVVPVALAFETAATALKVAAPPVDPAVGAIPTVATPELSVNAVLALKVATAELKLNVTSLLAMAAPDPSSKVALAE